jgi:hypothetical protein
MKSAIYVMSSYTERLRTEEGKEIQILDLYKETDVLVWLEHYEGNLSLKLIKFTLACARLTREPLFMRNITSVFVIILKSV